ncbi:MAG TPA: hypothetical protein VIA18_15635 [Polyangia bacterium]|nr:hypothetical protein [Polyangia bacterium]
MTKTALLLGLGTLLFVAPPVHACPNDRAAFVIDGIRVVHCLANCGADHRQKLTSTIGVGDHETLLDEGLRLSDGIYGSTGDDDAAMEAAFQAEESATATAMHAWMQSLASGLLALVAVALAGVGLARLGQMRRPLAMTVMARRPVPAAVVLSLLSPVVPPLVLMHAEREILPSPVLLMASALAFMALSMLFARKRLASRLRWAAIGRLGGLEDGTLVLAELEPKKLLPPPGARGRVPWFMADLSATSDGELARVALAQADVDDRAARILSRLANGISVAGETLTVLGAAVRVPADVAAADPLCRSASTQARVGRAPIGRAIIAAGTPAMLLRRLHIECVLLGALCGICLAAAGLAFFS